MHIGEQTRLVGIPVQKGNDGKRALGAEVYAFEIAIPGWRVRDWWCMAEDEPVNQTTNLLRCVDYLCLDGGFHTKLRAMAL